MDKYLTPNELKYKFNYKNEDYKKRYEKLVYSPLCNEDGHQLGLDWEYLSYKADKFKVLYNIFKNDIVEKENVKYLYAISEIRGSLSVEGIHSSKKKIKEIEALKTVNDEKDQNILNILNAFEFIHSQNKISHESLLKMYNILTNNIDLKENTLDGKFYREEEVDIGNVARGVKAKSVYKMMDELIDNINFFTKFDNFDDSYEITLLTVSNIIHYQFLYIHPYYDRNGRMARLLSSWLAFKISSPFKSIPISEMIALSKSSYYEAIQNVRDSYEGRDCTYFINYMIDKAIEYLETEIIIKKVALELKNKLIIVSSLEQSYLKLILMSKFKHNYFGYKDFKETLKIIDEDKTKQGIFNILNNLANKTILETVVASDNKTRLYKVSEKIKAINIINF